MESENVKPVKQIKQVSEKTLNFYENAKYNVGIRMVYEEFVSMLRRRNIERRLRSVLDNGKE